jgi:hypothetical protein
MRRGTPHALFAAMCRTSILRPAQCRGLVCQRILTFTRFLMVDDLLTIGLTHIDDRHATDVPVGYQTRPETKV